LNDLDLAIGVPTQAPDAVDAVVVLHCDGDITCDATRLLSLTQENHLRVFDGRLSGGNIQFGQGKQDNATVEQWNEPGETVTWQVRVEQPVTYNITATYDAEDTSAGSTYAIKAGGQVLCGIVQAGKEISQPLGAIHFNQGPGQVQVE